MLEINLPKKLEEISNNAFEYCTSLETIKLPVGITRISRGLFINCENLTNVSIPESVETIEPYAFQDCKNLKSIIIPDNVAKIDTAAFLRCEKLLEINLPKKLEEISNNAFEYCTSLETIKLPVGITRISRGLFINCENLTNVSIPESVETIEPYAFQDCKNLKSIIIPDNVAKIDTAAFLRCEKISEIYLPQNLRAISYGLFCNCENLTNVSIPESVETIEPYAFQDCKNLKSIIIPDNVAKIDTAAFLRCEKISEIYLPQNLRAISYGLFCNCENLTNVSIPESVETIEPYAFQDCKNLKSIIIPDNVAKIDTAAFLRCEKISEIYLPKNLKAISCGLFMGCKNLKNIVLPNDIKEIFNNAFAYCTSLETIKLPDEITRIPRGLFYQCSNLKTLTIPESVDIISAGAFENCENLKSIKLPSKISAIGIGMFRNCKKLQSITLPKGITQISSSMFENCESLSEIIIPNGVTQIWSSAFVNCKKLSSIYLPESVEKIDSAAFFNCVNLKRINLPKNLTTIGRYAFAKCNNVKDVTIETNNFCLDKGFLYSADSTQLVYCFSAITMNGSYDFPKKLRTISDYAFAYCNHTSFNFSKSNIEYIGKYAFEGNTDLESIILPPNISIISDHLFEGCRKLQNIEVPEKVYSIGKEAFKECNNLKSITIPKNVMFIEDNTFAGCIRLSTINSKATYPPILGSNVFNDIPENAVLKTEETNLKNYANSDWNKYFKISLPIVELKVEELADFLSRHYNQDTINLVITNPTNENIKTVGDIIKNSSQKFNLTLRGNPSFTVIPKECFGYFDNIPANDALKSIVIPESVEKIDDYAFRNCTSLNKVEMSSGIKEIGHEAFFNCQLLKNIFLPENNLVLGKRIFALCNKNFKVKFDNQIPQNFVEKTISVNELKNYSDTASLDFVHKITVIGVTDSTINTVARIVRNCRFYIYLTIADSEDLTTIPNNAFIYSKRLLRIVLPDNVKRIGDYAFYCCFTLEEVKLPKKLKEIGNYAFESCISIRELHIPNSVTNIAEGAFESCNKLKNVNISSSLTDINKNLFCVCTSLNNIIIPENIKSIGEYSFFRSGLENIIIPFSVDTIKNAAFNACFNMTKAVINNTNVVIGEEIFTHCIKFSDVEASDNIRKIIYDEMAGDFCKTDYDNKAIYFFNKYFDIREKLNDAIDIDYIINKIRMGVSYQCISDYRNTIQILEPTIELAGKLNFDSDIWYYWLYRTLIISYIKLGKYEQAQSESELFLKYAKKAYGETHSNYAYALTILGDFCKEIGDYNRAKEYYKKADDLLGNNYDTHLNMAEICIKTNDIQNAEHYLNILKVESRNIDARYANFLLMYSKLQYGVGNYDAASLYSYLASFILTNSKGIYECRKINWQSLIKTNDYINIPKYVKNVISNNKSLPAFAYSDYMSILGEAYYKLNYYDSAFNAYSKNFKDELLKLKENFSFMNSYQKQNYWQEHNVAFDNIVKISTKILQNKESLKLAYNSLLLTKGLLLASEQRINTVIQNSSDESLVSDFYLLMQYRKKIDEAKTTAKIDSLSKLAQKLETQLIKRSSQFADIIDYINIDWQKVKKSLKVNDVAIEFFYVDSSLYALLLKKSFNVPKLITLIDLSEDRNLYSTFEMYEKIWKPIEKYFSKNGKVYFAPSEKLYTIAIEYAPIDDKQTISDKYNLYRISSTRNLALKYERNLNKKAAVYGGIKYNFGKGNWEDMKNNKNKSEHVFRDYPLVNSENFRSGVQSLTGTQIEAEAIANTLRAANYVVSEMSDIAATEESFKNLSGSGISILHIGTHGFYQQEDTVIHTFLPLLTNDRQSTEDLSLSKNGLLLAGANTALDSEKRKQIPDGVEDGILTAKEISRLDFKGLDLVVLSACETGLGKITGDGVFGLQRGFKKAGAQTIIMSLWKVVDDATQLLMTEFFKNLTSGKSKRESFISAQNTVKEKYPDPMYWAAFIMVDGM